MEKMLAPMISELQQEAGITRKVLERVPTDKLGWKPHPKSMSLGQLALHIASIPATLSKVAQLEEFDVATATFNPPEPKDAGEILSTLESSVNAAKDYLGGMSESAATGSWRMTSKCREVLNIPRVAMLRSIMLNHWYHHRGQLSVYLRLLDVPVPAIYGRSADENPLA